MQFGAEAERLRGQIDMALDAQMAVERIRLENDLRQAIALCPPKFVAFLEVVDDGTGPAVASHWSGHETGLAELDWYFPRCSGGELADIHVAVTLVCDAWNVKASELQARNRTRRYTNPRQVLCYLLHEVVGLSYPEIGRMVHRDHSTVMSNVQAVRRRAAGEPYFADRLERFTHTLEARRKAFL